MYGLRLGFSCRKPPLRGYLPATRGYPYLFTATALACATFCGGFLFVVHLGIALTFNLLTLPVVKPSTLQFGQDKFSGIHGKKLCGNISEFKITVMRNVTLNLKD